jgi:hypothetical protein
VGGAEDARKLEGFDPARLCRHMHNIAVTLC